MYNDALIIFLDRTSYALISPPLSLQTLSLRASYEGGVNIAVANCPTEELIGSFEEWNHEDTGPGKTSSISPTPTPVDRETLRCIARRTRGAKVTDATCVKYTIGCTYHSCMGKCAARTAKTSCEKNCRKDCMSSCGSRATNSGCKTECNADELLVDEW